MGARRGWEGAPGRLAAAGGAAHMLYPAARLVANSSQSQPTQPLHANPDGFDLRATIPTCMRYLASMSPYCTCSSSALHCDTCSRAGARPGAGPEQGALGTRRGCRAAAEGKPAPAPGQPPPALATLSNAKHQEAMQQPGGRHPALTRSLTTAACPSSRSLSERSAAMRASASPYAWLISALLPTCGLGGCGGVWEGLHGLAGRRARGQACAGGVVHQPQPSAQRQQDERAGTAGTAGTAGKARPHVGLRGVDRVQLRPRLRLLPLAAVELQQVVHLWEGGQLDRNYIRLWCN